MQTMSENVQQPHVVSRWDMRFGLLWLRPRLSVVDKHLQSAMTESRIIFKMCQRLREMNRCPAQQYEFDIL